MAITTMDGLVAALATGQHRHVLKSATGGAGSGHIYGGVTSTGYPSPGVVTLAGATNGVIPTQTLAGALLRFTNPSGSNTLYLAQLTIFPQTNQGVLSLYDRLFHAGSFAGTTTSITITSPPALTRPDANGTGAEIWVEVATATTTAQTITVTYTNSAGTGSRTGTGSIKASGLLGELFPVKLQAGDAGVKSIQSYSLSGSLTAGTINILILRRIAYVPITTTAVISPYNSMDLGLPIICPDAFVMHVTTVGPSSSQSIQFLGSVTLVQG